MTDKKSGESRRKLLKSIAAGSGAIVAGKSLPESWSKPVVDSVMLPAHAETSPPSSASCSGLNFTYTLTCDASAGGGHIVYGVDDTGTCPVLTEQAQQIITFPINEDEFVIGFNRNNLGINLTIYYPSIAASFIEQNCGGTSLGDLTLAPSNDTFLATSGATWSVQVTLSRTSTTVSADVVLSAA